MAAKNADSDGETGPKNSVKIEDGKLTYRRATPDPRVTRAFSAEIETREVNQYTTIETKYSGFESTVSSNTERNGAYLLMVRSDGGYRVADLHSPEAHAETDPNTIDGVYLWDSNWDCKIADGIRNKTVRSWSDTYESGSISRTKIEREAVDHARKNDERLFVVEYESRKGGSSGSRGNESRNWNNFQTIRVLELTPEPK